jgi:hypothetical protein
MKALEGVFLNVAVFSAGQSLLKQYGGSLSALLNSSYGDEYEFHEWLFEDSVPVGFWNVQSNAVNYLDWLAKKIGINELDEWYNVTKDVFLENHGSGLSFFLFSFLFLFLFVFRFSFCIRSCRTLSAKSTWSIT